jgi:hypothetical protein
MNKIAVIDLGTNTFHLLIVERTNDVPFRQVFRQQVYAKLGIGGVDFIIPESFERGLVTLAAFQEAIATHGAESRTGIRYRCAAHRLQRPCIYGAGAPAHRHSHHPHQRRGRSAAHLSRRQLGRTH